LLLLEVGESEGGSHLLRLRKLDLELMMLDLGILPYLLGQRGILEHRRNLGDLRLELWYAVGDHFGHVHVALLIAIEVLFSVRRVLAGRGLEKAVVK
jgi:hypothetical protein